MAAVLAVVLPVLVLSVVVPQRPNVEAPAKETSAPMLHPATLANASANDHGAPHKNILPSRPSRLKRMPPPPEPEEGRGARARMPPQTNENQITLEETRALRRPRIPPIVWKTSTMMAMTTTTTTHGRDRWRLPR